MGYIFKNENPYGKMVDDCVIRAIATATGQSWDRTAHDLFEEQLAQKDLQNSNTVWGQVLRNKGFIKRNLPCTEHSCYTVREFALSHPTTPVYGRTPIFTCPNQGYGCGCSGNAGFVA